MLSWGPLVESIDNNILYPSCTLFSTNSIIHNPSYGSYTIWLTSIPEMVASERHHNTSSYLQHQHFVAQSSRLNNDNHNSNELLIYANNSLIISANTFLDSSTILPHTTILQQYTIWMTRIWLCLGMTSVLLYLTKTVGCLLRKNGQQWNFFWQPIGDYSQWIAEVYPIHFHCPLQ